MMFSLLIWLRMCPSLWELMEPQFLVYKSYVINNLLGKTVEEIHNCHEENTDQKKVGTDCYFLTG